MKRIEIEILKMLPIESPSNLRFSNAIKYSYDAKIIHPPVLVPHENSFITIDGHRRIISRLIRGEQSMIGRIVETDEEIDFGEIGGFFNIEGIAWLIETYEKVWKPACLEEGIKTFYDYLLYIDKKYLKPQIDVKTK